MWPTHGKTHCDLHTTYCIALFVLFGGLEVLESCVMFNVSFNCQIHVQCFGWLCFFFLRCSHAKNSVGRSLHSSVSMSFKYFVASAQSQYSLRCPIVIWPMEN